MSNVNWPLAAAASDADTVHVEPGHHGWTSSVIEEMNPACAVSTAAFNADLMRPDRA